MANKFHQSAGRVVAVRNYYVHPQRQGCLYFFCLTRPRHAHMGGHGVKAWGWHEQVHQHLVGKHQHLVMGKGAQQQHANDEPQHASVPHGCWCLRRPGSAIRNRRQHD